MILKLVRRALGEVVILVDKITSPTPIKRDVIMQKNIDEKTKNIILYQFRGCPFCIKVRRVIKKLSLNIEKFDITDHTHKKELLEGGGKTQVPCLRIKNDDNTYEWLYESDNIIEYLEKIVNLEK